MNFTWHFYSRAKVTSFYVTCGWQPDHALYEI